MKQTPVLFSVLMFLLLTAAGPGRLSATEAWINEFHYDNAGTDTAEFVEIVIPSSLLDLASIRLTLYNGGDGRTYGSAHLLSTFSAGDTVGGMTFYTKAIPGLQNGAPDGMSLDIAGEVVHFISYEGLFTASNGPASGRSSLDVGISEGDATPPGASIGFAGSGAGARDFVWSSLGVSTPGGLNLGQEITVPEPLPTLLVAYLGGGLMLVHRFQRRQRYR